MNPKYQRPELRIYTACTIAPISCSRRDPRITAPNFSERGWSAPPSCMNGRRDAVSTTTDAFFTQPYFFSVRIWISFPSGITLSEWSHAHSLQQGGQDSHGALIGCSFQVELFSRCKIFASTVILKKAGGFVKLMRTCCIKKIWSRSLFKNSNCGNRSVHA